MRKTLHGSWALISLFWMKQITTFCDVPTVKNEPDSQGNVMCSRVFGFKSNRISNWESRLGKTSEMTPVVGT